MKRMPCQAFFLKSAMHKRGCDAANEHFVRLAIGRVQREVDRLGDLGIFERKQRRDVDAIPRLGSERNGLRL